MTRIARRSIAVFVVMMLSMSVLGVVNQNRLRLQDELLTRKRDLTIELGELRSRAERVRGPLAVSAWARAEGMVPALENDRVLQVVPLPSPEVLPLPTGLEVDTRWR